LLGAEDLDLPIIWWAPEEVKVSCSLAR
jgi:hypothetical protein